MNQLKLNTQRVNSLSLNDVKKDLTKSEKIRELLLSMGYNPFNAKELKGEKCYSAYYKEFYNDNNDYKYSICCYCYNFSGLVENPEAFEFVLESQLETNKGLIGIESVQWIFNDSEQAFNNIRYFENLVDNNWIFGGSNKFPTQ